MASKRNMDYYDSFVKSIDCSCRASQLLKEVFKNNKIDTSRFSELHAIEHEGDTIHHEIVKELGISFITPIEREDILLIASAIDDFTDAIEDIATRMDMFCITDIHDDVYSFIDIICEAAEVLKEALVEFKNFKKSKTLSSLIQKTNELEENADDIYHKAVKNEFNNEKDPIELFKWREMYDIIEICCDSFEDVADTIENAIMKNS